MNVRDIELRNIPVFLVLLVSSLDVDVEGLGSSPLSPLNQQYA
jgi:hypothetical protein